MSTQSTTNIRDLYFEFKELTPIIGELEFDGLHQMLLEIKANLSSVPSTLGGGAHGYSGIILSAPTYATLEPRTPFLVPAHPGTLNVLYGATQYNIALGKSQHDGILKTIS